jgi:hypothetical protein
MHLAYIVEVVPGFWFLTAATLVALLAEALISLLSRAHLARQRDAQRLAAAGDWRSVAALAVPSRAIEIVAALIPFGVAAAFVRAIHGARSIYVLPMATGLPPEENAQLINRAIAGEQNATPMGLLAVSLSVGLAAVAVSLALSARLRARGLRQAAAKASAPAEAAAWLEFPGPPAGAICASLAAFLVLGFGPIVQAGHLGVAGKIKTFATVGGMPVDQKAALIDQSLNEASRLLDRSLLFSRAGVAIAAVLAAFVVWKFSATRARARVLVRNEEHSRQGATGAVIAGVAIVFAIAAFVAARPLRRENQLPWPPFAGGERLMLEIATADLDGPDAMKRAPVILVTPEVMTLDGYAYDAESLAARLDSLASMYRRIQPGVPYNGQSLIICQADTATERLQVALRAAVVGSAPHTTFGFLRHQETDRPLFGRRWRNIPSAARTTSITTKADAEPGATIIEVARFPTCAAISKEIVAARREGHEVALLLPTVVEPTSGR